MKKWVLLAAALGGTAWFALRESTPPASSPAPAVAQAGMAGRASDDARAAAAPASAAHARAQKQPPGVASVIEIRVTAAGKPRPGAEVRLYERAADDPFHLKPAWSSRGAIATGADGSARFVAGPGRFHVAARAPGFGPARREIAKAVGERTTRVELALEPGLSLSGKTVAHGEPVPLAAVTLTPIAGQRRRRGGATSDPPGEERAVATSDAAGRFRADGLAAGRYRVEASAAGFVTSVERVEVPAEGEVVLELGAASFIEGFVLGQNGAPAAGAIVALQAGASGGSDAASEATTSAGGAFSLEVAPGSYRLSARRGNEAGSAGPVAVAAGRTAREVVINLGPAASIAGWVTALASGQPVEGAQISVRPQAGPGDSGRATADAAGGFALEGLAPGTYVVEASAGGFTPASRRGITVSAGQKFPLNFALHATGAVRGTVRDASGRPIASATVSVRGGAQLPVRTTEAGEFRITGLAVGRLQLSASRDGSPFGERRVVDVQPGDEARADFTLAGDGQLTGRVTAQGRGAAGAALVRVRADWGALPRELDVPVEDGVYRAALPAGRYTVCAVRESSDRRACRRSGASASVEDGKTTSVDLTLAPEDERSEREEPDEAQISGTVVEPNGSPSPGAVVTLGDRAAVVYADADGKYALTIPDRVRPPLAVRAWNGARGGSATWDGRGGDLNIQLAAGASLRGRLVSGGQPPDSFILRAGPADVQAASWPMGVNRTYEFAGDRFELPEVPPTRTRIRVRTADGRTGEAVADLSAGAGAEVEVQLEQQAVITGRAVDSAGAPLARVSVRFDDHAAVAGDEDITGADGRFSVSGLQPGERTLRMRDPKGRSLVRRVAVAPGQRVDLGDLALDAPKIASGTIGVQLRGRMDAAVVSRVLLDSPAMRAGVLEGDVIVAVDGVAAKNRLEAQQRIAGAPATPVALRLRRGGGEATVTVLRAP